MKKVGVGIVGFGRIGKEHAGWLRQCEGIEPLAIADATAARRELGQGAGLMAYSSIEQLLQNGEIDAVLIATPTAMHCEQALAALAAGKHVMIEKPMALDLEQSRRIAEASTRRGRVVSVFQNRRWDMDYLTVKNAIGSGQLGRIINVESRLGQWASCVGPAAKEYRPGWRNEASFGGGGLYDWGSHFVDQLWRLMLPATPVRVFAQLRGNVWTKDCDDFARVVIDFDNGAVGLVEINTTTTQPLPRWHIDGTLGSATSPFSLEFDLHTWSQLSFTPADKKVPSQMMAVAQDGLDEIQIWERFAVAIGGNAEPAVSVASVLSTMALLDAARESSREGRAILVGDSANWVL